MRNAFVILTGFFILLAPLALSQEVHPGGNALIPAPAASGNFQYYLKHTYGPTAQVGASLSAAWGQARNHPPEWGQDGHSFGKRWASAYGRRVIKNTVDLGVANLRGEVLRYERCECSGLWARTGHAVKRTLFRRTDDGGTTFAAGRFAGAYASGFASNLWYPDSRNDLRHGLISGTTCIGFDIGKNIVKEFWPDIKRKLFRR